MYSTLLKLLFQALKKYFESKILQADCYFGPKFVGTFFAQHFHENFYFACF